MADLKKREKMESTTETQLRRLIMMSSFEGHVPLTVYLGQTLQPLQVSSLTWNHLGIPSGGAGEMKVWIFLLDLFLHLSTTDR